MTEDELDAKLDEVTRLLTGSFSDDVIAEIIDMLSQDYVENKLGDRNGD